MADKNTGAEEKKGAKVKAEKADSQKKSSAKPEKKKARKNPFKSAGKFFKGVNAERKKVVWPKAKETLKNSVVVLVVVAILGVAIYAVDSLLALGLKGIKQAKESTSVSETVDDTAQSDSAAEAETQAETQAAE